MNENKIKHAQEKGMKWLEILQIEEDADCRCYEITFGLYNKQPKIHFSDKATEEEPSIVKLIIYYNQLKTLTQRR